MKKARIIFKDNTPFSLDFDDFYFNSKDGVAESQFIYSEAFEWRESQNFVIAETGFGIGLNFFLTLKRFFQSQIRPKNLFYISVEGFYLSQNEIKSAYEKLGIYEEFKAYLDPFLKNYPKCHEGYYRFYFGPCFLDLVFGDISILKKLEFQADVWYLDGFSPRKNEEMFNKDLLAEVARLSKIGTQILSFSASSFFQKNLKNQGFEVQKIKGFKKREMVRAFLREKMIEPKKEGYFSAVKLQNKNRKIAIIGGGICAAVMAYELSLRSYEIEIFEKNSSLGKGASGNESGILSSLILKPDVPLGEFSFQSFIEASRFYKQNLVLNLSGVLEFAHNEKMQERFKTQVKNPYFSIFENKAFLEDGGHIYPQKIVYDLLQKSGAKIHLNHHFTHYDYQDELFTLHFKNASVKKDFGILIYAMGSNTKDFLSYEAMHLSKVRGQLSLIKPILDTPYPLSSKGYICPPHNDFQVIGASYDRLSSNPKPESKDDEENWQNVKEFLKDEAVEFLASRVGFRSYSSDRFCIVGAAYDEAFYKQNYKALLWTKNKPQILAQNQAQLYLNFAHGSRAFSTSILAARYICALINDEPLGFFSTFIPHIHPARFLIRKLKKGF